MVTSKEVLELEEKSIYFRFLFFLFFSLTALILDLDPSLFSLKKIRTMVRSLRSEERYRGPLDYVPAGIHTSDSSLV